MNKKEIECFRAAIQLYSSISTELKGSLQSDKERLSFLEEGYNIAKSLYEQIERELQKEEAANKPSKEEIRKEHEKTNAEHKRILSAEDESGGP